MAKRKIKTIGNFKAPSRRKADYKSEEHYLRAVYRANKVELAQKGITFGNFKEVIKSYKEEDGLATNRAIRAYSRTRLFVSQAEQGLENIQKNLTREISTEIRKATGNYKKKIDWRKDFTWDSANQMYIHSSGNFGLVFTYPDDSKTESIVSIINM